MATITSSFNIDSANLTKAINRICKKYNYDEMKQGNETKGQFAQRIFNSRYLKFARNELREALKEERDTANPVVDVDAIITPA